MYILGYRINLNMDNKLCITHQADKQRKEEDKRCPECREENDIIKSVVLVLFIFSVVAIFIILWKIF